MSTTVQNTADFTAKIQEGGKKVLMFQFFASWCGQCKQFAPKVKALVKTYEKTISWFCIDIDDCVELKDQFEIENLPTFVFYKNGQNVDTYVGTVQDKLEQHIKKFV